MPQTFQHSLKQRLDPSLAAPPGPSWPAAKRCSDLLGLCLLLPLLLPLGGLVGLLLVAQGGSVLHAGWRVGRGGRMFRQWKFRTMHLGAEAALPGLLTGEDGAAQAWRDYGKMPRDPRVTPLGRILRRYSLDELPQFWNVLRGEMSLVGPRPVPPEELHRVYGRAAPCYLACRPGLSGLWQVSGRNRLCYAQRVALDCHYARHGDLWLDFLILWRTFGVVLRGTGC